MSSSSVSDSELFRKLLVDISDKLHKNDIERLAYIYDIPMGERSEITALALLRELEIRGTFSINNIRSLETLCDNISRHDLTRSVRKFKEIYELSRAPPLAPGALAPRIRPSASIDPSNTFDIQEYIAVRLFSEIDPILSELEDVVLELEAPKDIQEDIKVQTDTFLTMLLKFGGYPWQPIDVESESGGKDMFSILTQTVDFLNFHMLTEFHKEATADSYFLKETQSIKVFMEKTTIHEYLASPLPRKRCEKLCPYKKLFSEVSFHLERSVAIVTLLDCDHLRRQLYDMITTGKLPAEVLFYDVTSGSVILKLWVRQAHAQTLSTIMMKIPSSDVKVLREAGVVKVYVDGKPLEIHGLERVKKIPTRGKKSIESIRKELMTMRKKNAKLEKRVGELEKVHARSEVKELQSLLDKRPTIEQLQYLSWNDGIEQRQLRIIDQCSAKWKRIAVALGLFIYANSISDREDQMFLVFCKWLQAKPGHCWRLLIDALETVELFTLAYDLKQALPFIYTPSDTL